MCGVHQRCYTFFACGYEYVDQLIISISMRCATSPGNAVCGRACSARCAAATFKNLNTFTPETSPLLWPCPLPSLSDSSVIRALEQFRISLRFSLPEPELAAVP